jgi:hypothetical protein
MLYPVRSCCIAALALGLAGCSMHPLPENYPLNFPRASTFDIVQKVRCEAKAGLARFKDSRRPEHVKKIVQATSIGYDFKLVMAETNNAEDGALDFVRKPAKKGSKDSFTVNVTGEATKARSNTRTFRIVEDLAAVANADCSDQALRANLAYPISGSLRVDDIVSTYVRLEMISNLDQRGEDAAEVPAEDDPRKRTGVFSDFLVFNTRLSLDATPTLKVSAVAGSFKLTNAGIHGSAVRSDQHSLIIAFAQDPDFHKTELERVRNQRAFLAHKTELDRARGQRAFLVQRRQARPVVESVPLSVVSEPRTQTTLVAANAVARNKVLLELARLRNLADDEEETPRFLGERLLTFLRPPEETGPGERP